MDDFKSHLINHIYIHKIGVAQYAQLKSTLRINIVKPEGFFCLYQKDAFYIFGISLSF